MSDISKQSEFLTGESKPLAKVKKVIDNPRRIIKLLEEAIQTEKDNVEEISGLLRRIELLEMEKADRNYRVWELTERNQTLADLYRCVENQLKEMAVTKTTPQPKGRTLWDRLTGSNVLVVAEEKYHNPLKARIGNTFNLDLLDHRELFYSLKSIDVINRRNGTKLADYRLQAKPFGTTDTKELVLRTVPRDGKVGKEKIDFRILSLSTYFACGWNDDARGGIMEGVNDPRGEFVINPGTEHEQKYFRLHGLKDPYTATVNILKDDDNNGIVEDEEIETKTVKIWDFSRTTLDEAKQEVNEYLYVQKDEKTGWIEILLGTEVPPERIIV